MRLNGSQLPRRAKEQLTAGADYTLGTRGAVAELRDPRRRPVSTTPRTPCRCLRYTTADLYADWQFAKDFACRPSVDNVIDRRLTETAYGFNQAGRSFI